MKQHSLKNTLIYFTGEDTRLISATIAKWREDFAIKHGAYNIREFDNPMQHSQELFSLLRTPSLLGDKRMLILKGFPQKSPTKKEDAEAYAEFEEAFLALVPLITEDTVVLLQANNPDNRKKTVKLLLQASVVKEFRPSSSLNDYIQRANLSITAADKVYLQERIGKDSERVYNDMQKLSLFADGGGITREDIDRLIYSSLEVEVFSVLSGLHNAHEAAKKMQLLLDRGHEPLALMGAFVWYFERLGFVASLLKDHSREEIMALLDIKKTFAFDSVKRALHTFPLSRITHAFSLLAQFDRQLKNGELSFSAEDKEEVSLAVVELVLRI